MFHCKAPIDSSSLSSTDIKDLITWNKVTGKLHADKVENEIEPEMEQNQGLESCRSPCYCDALQLSSKNFCFIKFRIDEIIRELDKKHNTYRLLSLFHRMVLGFRV